MTGASRDVISVLHEFGHAFQDYQSRDKRVLEYLMPTSEAGKIHAMALEYLMFPQYERFFGRDASRCRSNHLRSMLGMLPYVAAIDHFQELVYEMPTAMVTERAGLWRSLERRYLPWRQSGGVPYLASGRAWQRQRHVYAFPFYYIDYGLAMCCALEIWAHSVGDNEQAVRSYLELCALGGELPFRQLLKAAHLRSPFEPGTLLEVARQAETALLHVA